MKKPSKILIWANGKTLISEDFIYSRNQNLNNTKKNTTTIQLTKRSEKSCNISTTKVLQTNQNEGKGCQQLTLDPKIERAKNY